MAHRYLPNSIRILKKLSYFAKSNDFKIKIGTYEKRVIVLNPDVTISVHTRQMIGGLEEVIEST